MTMLAFHPTILLGCVDAICLVDYVVVNIELLHRSQFRFKPIVTSSYYCILPKLFLSHNHKVFQ